MTASVAHKVVHDEEVGDEPGLGHHAQLLVYAGNDGFHGGIGGGAKLFLAGTFSRFFPAGQAASVLDGNGCIVEFLAIGGHFDIVADFEPFAEQLFQAVHRGLARRRCPFRIVEGLEIEIHIAAFGDVQRIGDSVRRVCKEGFHLLGGTQIELLRRVGQTLGIVYRGLGADADQHVMRVRVFLVDVVNVVSGHQLDVHFAGDLDQFGVDFELIRDAVLLDLQIVMIRPEQIHIPLDRLARFLQISAQDQLGDLSGQTG